jgi:HK97 family phage major capsid protein
MRLDEIEVELTAIRAQLKQLEDNPSANEGEDGDAVDTLIARHDELQTLATPLRERMEKLAQIRTAAKDVRNVERSAPDMGGDSPLHRKAEVRDPEGDETQHLVRNALLPVKEIKGLALDLVERSAKAGAFGGQGGDDRAEVATRRIQDEWRLPNPNPEELNIAQHILMTGTEEYQDAFYSYVRNPMAAQRTALSLTLANGGYLLPYVLDPTIVLTNASSANPWRRISRNETTTSNAWQGVNSAGVTAQWLGEGTASADASPTVGQIQVVPKKAAAWVFGSYEVLADTDFAQQLPNLLADARDRLEEAAFATGAGSATVPQGVVNGATTTVSTATTLVYAIGDVYATQAALPPRFRNAPKAAWVMNVTYINKTRQFDTAGGASFWTNLGKGQPETLLGAPIYESTTMFGGVQAVNSLLAIFGDFNQYVIVDRVGVSLIYEPLVKDQATAFPTGQGGWFMFWRTGAQLATVNGFRVLKGL